MIDPKWQNATQRGDVYRLVFPPPSMSTRSDAMCKRASEQALLRNEAFKVKVILTFQFSLPPHVFISADASWFPLIQIDIAV